MADRTVDDFIVAAVGQTGRGLFIFALGSLRAVSASYAVLKCGVAFRAVILDEAVFRTGAVPDGYGMIHIVLVRGLGLAAPEAGQLSRAVVVRLGKSRLFKFGNLFGNASGGRSGLLLMAGCERDNEAGRGH